MSQAPETNEPKTNMERLKEEASACGPGCSCNAGASGRVRWLLGAIVLVAALLLVVRAVTEKDEASAKSSTTAFVGVALAEPAVPLSEGASVAAAKEDSIKTARIEERTAVSDATGDVSEKPVASTRASAPAALSASVTSGTLAASPDAKGKQGAGAVVCGESIRSLSELNRKALDKEGVFVFLAGKDAEKNRQVAAVVESAADILRARQTKLGVFTLEAGSNEYASVAKQVTPPCVLALVKGRGMSAVSDEITEFKLVQAFVSAGNAGGGCGTSCGPGAAGCN